MNQEINRILEAQKELLVAIEHLSIATAALLKSSQEEQYVSAKTYAEMHGCSTTSVYRWLDSGELEGKRIGSKRMVKL